MKKCSYLCIVKLININGMQDVNKLFFNNSQFSDEPESESFICAMLNAVSSYERITGSSCLVIDFDKHQLLYKTTQMLYFDEACLNDKQRDCENPYWSLVKEDILSNLLLLRNNYPLNGHTMENEDYKTHVCTIDYPITIRGRDFFINQKFTPLVMRSDGITKIGLFVFNPSTRTEMECFIIAQSGMRWRFNFQTGQFHSYDLNKTLSIVEKLIIQRMRKGMTNEQIADNLNLSVPTIKTHRMRIFKKLNVKTMSEALTLIGNYHLL